MDEIFGRENFVKNLIVNLAPAGTQSSNNFAKQHSYALIYQKTSKFSVYNIKLSKDEINKKYINEDKNGKFYTERIWKRGIGGRKEDVSSLHFSVYFNKENNEILIDDEINNVTNQKKLHKNHPLLNKGRFGTLDLV